MTSIKVKFRPSTVEGREGSVYYQVIHGRTSRQLSTDCRIYPEEWDANRDQVIVRKESPRLSLILSIRERIRRDVARMTKITRKFEESGSPYTAADVIDEFNRYSREYSLFNYMEGIIIRQKHNGKLRTSETYASALSSFRKFRKDEDIMLDCIDSVVIEKYESWLKGNGLMPNSIGFYNRILRAVYNSAVYDEITEDRNPFRNVYCGVDKTVKRALPIPVIKKMSRLDLSMSPALDYARDMFMMSLYLRGMSLVDMAGLKKSDLKDRRIVYRRRKTGQQLIVGWEPEMQKILDKYPDGETDRLLPIITGPCDDERKAYRNKGYNINRGLKRIAKKLGLEVSVTLYAARHSWASAAKANGIPLSVISQGLGHDSEATTQIYLASLDTSVIDKANSAILKSLRK